MIIKKYNTTIILLKRVLGHLNLYCMTLEPLNCQHKRTLIMFL